jgi:hypothetical protein
VSGAAAMLAARLLLGSGPRVGEARLEQRTWLGLGLGLGLGRGLGLGLAPESARHDSSSAPKTVGG